MKWIPDYVTSEKRKQIQNLFINEMQNCIDRTWEKVYQHLTMKIILFSNSQTTKNESAPSSSKIKDEL